MVRRPFVVILMAYLAGCLLQGVSWGILLGIAVMISIGVVFYMRKVPASRHDTFLYFVPAIFILGFLLANNQEKVFISQDKLEKEQSSVMIEGKVIEIIPSKKTEKVLLSNVKIRYPNESDVDYADHVIIYSKNISDIHIGYCILVNGEVKMFTPSTNPGQFNEKSYYERQNVSFAVFEKNHRILTSRENVIGQKLYEFRVRLRNVYETLLPENQSGFVCAMILGEKNQMDEELKQVYSDLGIAHIFAISGLHITLLGMGLYYLLERMRMALAVRVGATIMFLVLYGILTNFSVSTNRAVVMLSILLGAKVAGKCYDIISAVCFSALIILFQKPLEIYESGFLLSYLSITAIAVVSPVFSNMLLTDEIPDDNKINKVKQTLYGAILFSFSISVVTLPVMMNTFYTISPYSIIMNLIVIPLMPLVVILSIIGGMAGLFLPVLGKFFLGGVVFLLRFYGWMGCGIRKLPFSIVVTGRKQMWQILFYYVTVAIILVLIVYKTRKAFLLLVLSFLILFTKNVYRGLETTFLDVGQGDCICMRLPDKSVILVDGGSSSVSDVGKYRILPFLKEEGIDSIDYMIMTHSDSDHINGLQELISMQPSCPVKIKNLILPKIAKDDQDEAYVKIGKLAKSKGITVSYMTRGDRIKENEITITCLHPNDSYHPSDVNNSSTVLKVSYLKYTMLLTGDLGIEGEEEICKRELEACDVLKVGHHGSKNSSSENFLRELRPKIGIISAGKGNRYGHPHVETLKRLKTVKTSVYQTLKGGAITIKTDGRNSLIKQYQNHPFIGFVN